MSGVLRAPGDKSISHRALMLAAIAEGGSEIDNFLAAGDCLATAGALRRLGVDIEFVQPQRVVVRGAGRNGLRAAAAALDLGNSGTSMRLLSGLLAGQAFASELTGDRSLNARPMGRVARPLRMMGANIETTDRGTAPLLITPCAGLRGIRYQMPVASAQVKSCLLLAGLYAKGMTTIVEPAASRDHTERMLEAFSYPLVRGRDGVTVTGGGDLTAARIEVPGDISSVMFFIVAACIIKGSDLTIENVGINPTRTGALDILRDMGAVIEVAGRREAGGEPVADLRIKSCALRGIEIAPARVPASIDEFPALFVAAACARGATRLRGAAELRVKESDRIKAMADGLRRCGIGVKTYDDGVDIEGGRFSGAVVDAFDDHRVAMAFAVAGAAADSPVEIRNCAAIASSFPGFRHCANKAGLHLEEAGQ